MDDTGDWIDESEWQESRSKTEASGTGMSRTDDVQPPAYVCVAKATHGGKEKMPDLAFLAKPRRGTPLFHRPTTIVMHFSPPDDKPSTASVAAHITSNEAQE